MLRRSLAERRPPSNDLPAPTRRAADEIRTRQSDREAALVWQLARYYDRGFTTYRNDLRGYFGRTFHNHLDPLTKEPVWDPFRARRDQVVQTWTAAFDGAVATADDEVLPYLGAEVGEAFDEGFVSGLWLLYQSGLDTVLDDAPEPPDEETLDAAAADQAYEGATFEDRLQAWNATYHDKVARWLSVATLGAFVLGDTLDGLDRLFAEYTGRVGQLAANESYRAAAMGMSWAADAYEPAVQGFLWVSRRDARVCPICRALDNGKPTTSTPPDDSHPGCRCLRVPILSSTLTPNDLDYEAFAKQVRP